MIIFKVTIKFISNGLNKVLSDLIIHEEENAIKYAKRLPSKKDESLKNYAIFRFSCKPRETISSVAKHVFEKVFCKNGYPKNASPQARINTGFFGTSKPKGTTPTLLTKLNLTHFV